MEDYDAAQALGNAQPRGIEAAGQLRAERELQHKLDQGLMAKLERLRAASGFVQFAGQWAQPGLNSREPPQSRIGYDPPENVTEAQERLYWRSLASGGVTEDLLLRGTGPGPKMSHRRFIDSWVEPRLTLIAGALSELLEEKNQPPPRQRCPYRR